MMFSKEDLKVDSVVELIEFLPALILIALVFPFVAGAYKLGLVMDIAGWLDKD